MHNTELQQHLILYNKNPVGYVKSQIATVDTLFKNDNLEQWLSDQNLAVQWMEGVFDNLIENGKHYEIQQSQPLKDVRIWQLNSDFDSECRFVSFAEMTKKHGVPDLKNYHVVFDGELKTNDLEEIFTIFNLNHPSGFRGHSLSMSDVVELYDEGDCRLYYVDQFGYKEMEGDIEQAQSSSATMMGMQM